MKGTKNHGALYVVWIILDHVFIRICDPPHLAQNRVFTNIKKMKFLLYQSSLRISLRFFFFFFFFLI
jgi:hypothetical protein